MLRAVLDDLLAARPYMQQVRRYAQAVQHYLGCTPHAILCLLDDRGAVSLRDVV